MGKIISKPKVPKVVVPVKKETTEDAVDEKALADEQRRKKIALQEREQSGRSSTIHTSYRGVLSDTNSLRPKRKTLLGE